MMLQTYNMTLQLPAGYTKVLQVEQLAMSPMMFDHMSPQKPNQNNLIQCKVDPNTVQRHYIVEAVSCGTLLAANMHTAAHQQDDQGCLHSS